MEKCINRYAKTAARSAAVFEISAKNLKGGVQTPPAGRELSKMGRKTFISNGLKQKSWALILKFMQLPLIDHLK